MRNSSSTCSGRLLENLSDISVASSTGLLLKTIGLKIRCLL